MNSPLTENDAIRMMQEQENRIRELYKEKEELTRIVFDIDPAAESKNLIALKVEHSNAITEITTLRKKIERLKKEIER